MTIKIPPLPSYQTYREEYLNKGVQYPLVPLRFEKTGILKSIISPFNKTGWPWNEEVNPSIYSDKIRWPKITVVSPSYNQGAYLEETIRSVLLQNYPNIEYIVIDGKSNDNSVEILEKYQSVLSYFESEKDRGQSHAINKGFSLASGEIYCWINSDDYFTKDAFQKVALTFINTGAEFIYGNCFNLLDKTFRPYISPIIIDRFLSIPGLAQPSTFWSSKIHQGIWEELHCTLDFELWMRIGKGTKKKYINEFLSIARQHDQAKSYSQEVKMKAFWKEDHHKQWTLHGANNWKRLSWENRFFQKTLKIFPILKKLF